MPRLSATISATSSTAATIATIASAGEPLAERTSATGWATAAAAPAARVVERTARTLSAAGLTPVATVGARIEDSERVVAAAGAVAANFALGELATYAAKGGCPSTAVDGCREDEVARGAGGGGTGGLALTPGAVCGRDMRASEGSPTAGTDGGGFTGSGSATARAAAGGAGGGRVPGGAAGAGPAGLESRVAGRAGWLGGVGAGRSAGSAGRGGSGTCASRGSFTAGRDDAGTASVPAALADAGIHAPPAITSTPSIRARLPGDEGREMAIAGTPFGLPCCARHKPARCG